MLLGRHLIDDPHGLARREVRRLEAAAGEQPDVDRLEKVRRRRKPRRPRLLVGARRIVHGTGHRLHDIVVERSARWLTTRDGAGAGNRADLARQLLHESRARGIVRIAVDRRVQPERQLVARVEADVRVLEVHHRAEHEAGEDEQRQRERDLRGDENVAAAARFASAGRARVAQRLRRGAASGAERGPEAEEQRRQDGQKRRENQHVAVDADLLEQRVMRGRVDEPQPRVRQAQAREAADEAEQQAFGHERADELQPRRAERLAHREVMAMTHDAREHEVREVRARDQQHEDDDHGEQPEQHPCVRPGDRGVRRDDARREVQIRVGMIPSPAPRPSP